MWSACWSTATDSISFREVSRSAVGRSLVCFVPSGLSTYLISGTVLALSHSCLSVLFAFPHRPLHEGAQAFGYVMQCSPVGVSRPGPPGPARFFLPFPVSPESFSWTGARPSKSVSCILRYLHSFSPTLPQGSRLSVAVPGSFLSFLHLV